MQEASLLDEYWTGLMLEAVPVENFVSGPLRRISKVGLDMLKKSMETNQVSKARLAILAVPNSWMKLGRVCNCYVTVTTIIG